MRKLTRMLAVVLVLAMVVSVSACSLVSKDEDKDAAQVVATVNGVDILKSEVYTALRSNGLNSYGDPEYYFYEESAEDYEAAANAILDSLVSAEIARQKAVELSLDELTEDELAEMETNAKNYYDYYSSQIRTSLTEQNMQYGVSMTDEELDEEVNSTLANYLGIEDASIEGLLDLFKDYQIQTNLQEYIITDITVDEQKVKDYYDAQLDTQEGLAESDADLFETLIGAGTIAVYNIKPIHYVRHLLVKVENEDKLVNGEESVLYDMALNAYNTANTDALKDVAKGMLTPVYETLLPKAEALKARADAGEDFDALITEQIEAGDGDEAMQYYPDGYGVTEGSGEYMPEFEAAAVALTDIGQISDVVQTIYGYHILKLISITPVGPIAYEDVKDDIEASLLTEAQTAAVDDAYAQWETEATVERFENALMN